MRDRAGLFAPPKHPVLSLNVQAETVAARRPQGQFEVLVRHLLDRFFHNELLSSDDETKRVLQIGYAVTLPTLVVSLFLYPVYHAFPPAPFPRPFWPQVGDHYFFVMYAFVVMGAATVYEWDLLFPDLLDVFVLSTLPIATRRLFFARILALAIFLVMLLIGTSLLGTLFFPAFAELPHRMLRHLMAHAAAVLLSGTFAATTFLALQGVLLCTIGEKLFRRITPLLQGGSILVLLAILLLFPTISQSMEPLLTSDTPAIFFLPPLWFLGIYERLLIGPSVAPVFRQLALTGLAAIAFMLATTLVTYPLAYRRRVRQLVEGSSATGSSSRATVPIHHLLHRTILRNPSTRSIFHFIGQTILRTQRQRVQLAMAGGFAIALTLANMLVLTLSNGHIRPILLPEGIRAAVPILAFWTVTGLRSVLAAPIDRRASWLFRIVLGHPRQPHFAGIRAWVTLWTALVSLATVVLLHFVSPPELRTPLATATQLLVAIGISFLLPDVFLYPIRTLPFTHLHKGAITDLPLLVFKYVVLFPIFVSFTVSHEPWTEASIPHLLGTLIFFTAVHLLLVKAHTYSIHQSTLDTPPDEAEEFPQSLGLRDT